MDRDTLHVSVTDPMGHDIDAALAATVLVSALRGARRAGEVLAEPDHRGPVADRVDAARCVGGGRRGADVRVPPVRLFGTGSAVGYGQQRLVAGTDDGGVDVRADDTRP
ncbi:hypothetical protein ACFW93_34555 [Streptomyces canus]|uniref:hypothetical protein n=1 Tax=Streptomyces canus TaxID=58343 RepID=UPI0036C99A2B